MLVKELFFDYCLSNLGLTLNLKISAIETDSRLVKKNAIFFALKGLNCDGANFIDNAFANGAIIAVCDQNSDLSNLHNCDNPAIIKVKNIQQFFVFCLKKFYFPLPENILAVTGTNGKTSVSYFIWQMQEILGKKSASIGTIGVNVSDELIKKKLVNFSLTTPDLVSLYKNLSILKKSGIDDVSIEASSIGLVQKRLEGIKIGSGAFTNFSQDHLDYHSSMEEYFLSKMLLFSDVLPKFGKQAVAVLNADIKEFEEIKSIALEKKLSVFAYSYNKKQFWFYGQNQKIQRMLDFVNQQQGFKNFSCSVQFQNNNILCALLSVLAYYKPNFKQINLLLDNLSNIKPAEGRMQLARTLKNNAQIFIDYAHTPEALQNVLSTCKTIKHNNLYVLFGCGGNRDKGKRPLMGEIASNLADFVVITDDNPRNENPDEIRKEILLTCDLSKTVEIKNRKIAIEQTISRLKANDILIIAGKGHEKYQIIGEEKLPFDEKKIVNDLAKKQELTSKYQ